MADTQTQKKTLEQFSQWVVGEPELDVDSVIAEAMTYTPIREYFATHTEDLTGVFTAQPDESIQRLRTLFSNPRIFLPASPQGTETLTQFTPYEDAMTSLPVELVTPTRIKMVEQTHKTVSDLNKKRVAWIRDLVPEFVENLAQKQREKAGQTQTIPPEQVKIISKVVEEALEKPATAQAEIVNQAEEQAAKIPELAPFKPVVVETVKEFIARPIVAKRLLADTEVKTARAVIVNGSVTNPGVFAQAVANGLTEKEAVSYAQAAEVVTQARTAPGGVRSFGVPLAAKPDEAALQQSSIVGIWTRATNDEGFIGKVALRIGEEAAQSEQFKRYVLEATTRLSQQKPTSGAAVSIVSDVFASGKHSEVVADYAAALWQYKQAHPKATEALPSFMEYLIIWQQRQNPDAITRSPSGLLEWGAQIGLEKAAASAGIKLTAKEVGKAALTKLIPALAGSILATPVGGIILFFSDTLIKWGVKIAGGAFNYVLSLGPLNTILQSKPASLADTFVLFPFILMGALVLLFAVPILPFLNFADFPQTVRNAALVTSMGGSNIQGGGVALPPFAGAPAIPSDVSGCPTQNAYTLTQCPTGSYSHGNMWAYDLGFSGAMNVPIYATHDGVVAATIGTSQSSGYGNMVEIKGVTPSGTGYYTLYGHLARWAVQMGQQVKAGDLIGYGDDTGNSSGPHLHYEYRDANNNASSSLGVNFLPAACVSNPGFCSLQ